jgi:hypothetical protein
MKKYYVIQFLIPFLLLTVVFLSCKNKGINKAELATSSTIITFDSQTGALIHLVNSVTGQDFVSSHEIRPLFTLTLTKPHEGKSLGIPASDFSKVKVRRKSGKLELTFTEHKSMPLSVHVTATADNEGLVHLNIAVNKIQDWALSTIKFPQFVSPTQLGNEISDDQMIIPSGLGDILIKAPGSKTYQRSFLYPESMDMQFFSYYDTAAGLYMASYDSSGHYKRWRIVMEKDKLVEMHLTHLSPEVPALDVVLPYDVVLGTFTGDWRDAAGIYKKWAVQQPWCAKRISQRTDIPVYFREGSALLCVPYLHEKVQYKLFPFDHVNKLPEVAAEYQKRMQMPHIGFAPFGWENRGAWAGINYFPARPSDEIWRNVNTELHKKGNFTFVLPSGFSWVVKRRETRSGPAFDDTEDFEKRSEMVIHNADGKPWILDRYADETTWHGTQVKLCHSSKDARETTTRFFLDIARLGISVVQFDQEHGGGQSVPCYSKSHGHLPGFTNQYCTDFQSLCTEILKKGKSIDSEFGLSTESTSELSIPYMATMWGRQCNEVDAYGIGLQTMGLFSYIYHEYIPVMGDGFSMGHGMAETWGSAELRCYRLALPLVRGLIPTVYMETVPLEPKDEWQKTVSTAFFSYGRIYARFTEYLLRGITIRPPEVKCAMQDVWHYMPDDKGDMLPDGRRAIKVTVPRPTVVAGSFTAEDGSIGTVIVNTTSEKQPAKVKLTAGSRSATLFHVDRSEEQRWDHCPDEITVSLEPFGVRMLILTK